MRLLLAIQLILFAATGLAQTLPHHQLRMALHPEQHTLAVEDRIALPPGSPRTLYFSLHRDLNPTSPDAGIESVGECRKIGCGNTASRCRPAGTVSRLLITAKYFIRGSRMHAKRAVLKARRASSPQKAQCLPATAAGIRVSVTAC